MRLLIDMNLTPRWAEDLSAAGYEAIHWSNMGPATAKDEQICDYARDNDYVLLTSDLDFPQILAHTGAAKPSIVLLRGEPLTPDLRGAALLQALADCAQDLLQGAIISLDWSDKPRARVLPLR